MEISTARENLRCLTSVLLMKSSATTEISTAVSWIRLEQMTQYRHLQPVINYFCCFEGGSKRLPVERLWARKPNQFVIVSVQMHQVPLLHRPWSFSQPILGANAKRTAFSLRCLSPFLVELCIKDDRMSRFRLQIHQENHQSSTQ